MVASMEIFVSCVYLYLMHLIVLIILSDKDPNYEYLYLMHLVVLVILSDKDPN